MGPEPLTPVAGTPDAGNTEVGSIHQTRPRPPIPAGADAASAPTDTGADDGAPRDIVAPPAHRPTPTLKPGRRQVFFDFNQPPRDLVRFMDDLRQREQSFARQRAWRQVIAWLLFPAGVVFLLLDLALGYNVCTFSLVALTLWAAGVVGLIWLRRERSAPFDSRYDLTRQMFEVLKDDIAPGRTLTGWLDLTGAEQESKIIRKSVSASGQPIVYYQDEWLRLKAKLYDGSVLRASLFRRAKVRQGFYKRGTISGKMKWRAGSSQSLHRLRIAVTANPAVYSVQPVTYSGALPSSRFTFEGAEVVGSQLQLNAATLSNYDAWDVLNAMRFAYDQLQRRAVQ